MTQTVYHSTSDNIYENQQGSGEVNADVPYVRNKLQRTINLKFHYSKCIICKDPYIQIPNKTKLQIIFISLQSPLRKGQLSVDIIFILVVIVKLCHQDGFPNRTKFVICRSSAKLIMFLFASTHRASLFHRVLGIQLLPLILLP